MMSSPDDGSGVSRRRVLRGAGTATVIGGLAAAGLSGSGTTEEAPRFVVEQGDTCAPIEPLGDGDVVDFYGETPDLHDPSPRHSDTGLERAGVSRAFLFAGTSGPALVFVHGGGNDESGGAATFLVCGLPASGKWLVLDDGHEGARDEFHVTDHEAVLNWTWGRHGRNDGAVFGGLGARFCITIVPAFNEAAKLDPTGHGEVAAWQFLGGSRGDPDVIDLDMTEPLTIRTGTCDGGAASCVFSTATGHDPFPVAASFCCDAVVIDADTYDAVSLNLLDGTDQRFDGPFEGANAFIAMDDDDHNANDEIVRSATVLRDGDRVRIKNPNFDRCRTRVRDDDEEYGSASG